MILIEKVEKTITQYHMLKEGDKVVIGISGGPDSVALLHILLRLQQRFKLTLLLAHLNHLLREEAKQEALFVEKMAESLKLPIVIEEMDISQDTSKGLSIQQKARKIRYEFLIQIAKRLNASKIALAHHEDDNIETILMWLIRGCGAEGFKGIPPVRKINEGLYIIRPLIKNTRQEIEEYLKLNKLSFKIDSSNLKTDYLRNKIRLELLPKLKQYNPNIKKVLNRLSTLWHIDDEYLNLLSIDATNKVVLEKGRIDLKKFSDIHQAIQSRILRKIIEDVKGTLQGITFGHIEAILNLIKNGPAQGSLDLPSNIKVEREYDTLAIYKGKRKEERKGEEKYIKVPGVTEVEGLKIETQVIKKESLANFYSLLSTPSEAYLDYDKLKLPLLLRHRKKGDKFHPYGMAGSKKIKDFLIDLKVPKRKRDKIYLLEDNKGIIWIMGFNRIDERVKITHTTENVLVIRYK
ncbi:MAG: tRNA lysidine(34) synthetase TilS [bacterium]